jgi:hypothetical protein
MRSLRVSVGETRLLITDLTPRPRWVEQISGACAGLAAGVCVLIHMQSSRRHSRCSTRVRSALGRVRGR